MKVKFTYNKKIDNKCWKRYNAFLKENKTVWGLSKTIKPIIDIKKADFVMDVTDIMKKYEKIFDTMVKIKGYIVTTPFSMINDDGPTTKNGTIYYSIYTQNPSVVVAHEIFHIFFEKYTNRDIPNYEEAKEYFTVIMNDLFGSNVSGGYPNHQQQRNKIFKVWKKNHSIDDCVSYFKQNPF